MTDREHEKVFTEVGPWGLEQLALSEVSLCSVDMSMDTAEGTQ